jgi:peroxiredoxin Q/BCP
MDEVKQRKLEVLGVSFDDVAANRAFAEKFSFPYRLLCDTNREIGLAYGAADTKDAGYAKRISYVIDEQGKIALAYPKVSPKDHVAEVLRDVDALAGPAKA